MDINDLQTRPAFSTVSTAAVPLKDMAKGLKAYSDKHADDESPDLQAFAFYYLDHCVGLIKQKYPEGNLPEQLGQVVKFYHGLTTRYGMSMFAYLVTICNREFRYIKSTEGKIKTICGGETPAYKYFVDLRGSGSAGSYSNLVTYDGDCTVGSFAEGMTEGYYKGAWGNMYGGKKWGDIAKVLENYIFGRIPLSILLDQAFSLRHNTSAIFNKGVIYRKETGSLLCILDMQHHGGIPDIAYDIMFHDHDPLDLLSFKKANPLFTELRKIHVIMADMLGGSFGKHADWRPVLDSKTHAASSGQLQGLIKQSQQAFGVLKENVQPQPAPTAKADDKPVSQAHNKYYVLATLKGVESYKIVKKNRSKK